MANHVHAHVRGSSRELLMLVAAATHLLHVAMRTDAVAALQDNNALHINDQACFDGFYGAIK